MPTVTYACHRCEQTTRSELTGDTLQCQHCGTCLPCDLRQVESQGLTYCLVCPGRELFLRKDFSQRLGVMIVAIGFIASTIAWANYQILTSFGILFATAAIDLTLYLTMGNLIECYCCHAQYRGLPEEGIGSFDLEVHERHRQAQARLRDMGNQSPVNQSPVNQSPVNQSTPPAAS